MSAPRHFTLLELLVVVAILATLGGVVLASFGGVEEQAGQDLAKRELAELKRALLRFRVDTGYMPKQGPFELQSRGGAVPDPAAGAAWFDAPANLSQLVENPLAGTGHRLEAWSPDTRRGWRGPYLSRSGEGSVRVGSGLALDGRSGNLDQGTLLPPCPALADPFPAIALQAGPGAVFSWLDMSGRALTRQGRPYLVFDLDDPQRVRAVGLGPDGRYTPLPASGDLLVAPGSDDLGVYVLR